LTVFQSDECPRACEGARRSRTTPGQAAESDYRMLADLGFEIEECAL